MSLTSHYRYPGSLPFQDTVLDRQLFFGREREVQHLFRTVFAENLVVLVAKSGIGKTSLLNAGLLQRLRDKEFFPAMIRFNDPGLTPLESVYVGLASAIGTYRVECQAVEREKSLWQYFKTMEFWSSKEFWPSEDLLLTPVLILDQFEEFFMLHSRKKRMSFTIHLADLLRGRGTEAHNSGFNARPHVKVIISIREDFLADLDEMSSELPDILHNLVRLQPLQRDQARRAIEAPAQREEPYFVTKPFRYTSEAVETMLQFLCKRQGRERIVSTSEVDPFQLQLLCQHIENLVREDPGKTEIQNDDLRGEEGMHRVLEEFYDAQINKLTLGQEKTLVRNLCENGLISGSKRRRTLEQEDIESRFGVSRELLGKLVNARLLRAEHRLGSVYYELSHDTLIEPIKKSQKNLEEKERELREAEAKKREIQAIRAQEAKARNIEVRKRKLRGLIGGIAIIALILSVFMYQSLQKKYKGFESYNQGNELYIQEDYIHARQYFEDALELVPTISDAYQKLGIIYNKDGRYGNAVEMLLKVIELDNADAVTYKELGKAYLAVGKYPQATGSYQQAIALNPKDPEAFRGLGDVSFKTHELEQASENYAKALGFITPDYAKAYKGLGDIFFDQGNYDDAIEQYQKALTLTPDDTESLTKLGDAFLIQGKYNEAKQQYQKLSALRPRDINSKMRIAMLSLVTKDIERALTMGQELLREEFELTEPEHILITKFILISAHLFLENQIEAENTLNSFLQYYGDLSKDYEKKWQWDGIKKFISNSEEFSEGERNLLRTLIDSIESPLSEKAAQIKSIQLASSNIL